MRLATGLFIILVSLGCVAQPDEESNVYDYTYNNIFYYWKNRPVRVKIDPCTGYAECTSQHDASLRAGIALWQANASLFGEISIEEVDSDPDIHISWTRAILDMGNPSSIIGVCNFCLGTNSSGQVGAGRPWTIQMALTATVNSTEFLVSQTGIQLVGAHEMGHCLGLFQHSPASSDLMYFQLSNSTTFNIRDINTLRKLYSEKDNFAPSTTCNAAGIQKFRSGHEVYSSEFYE